MFCRIVFYQSICRRIVFRRILICHKMSRLIKLQVISVFHWNPQIVTLNASVSLMPYNISTNHISSKYVSPNFDTSNGVFRSVTRVFACNHEFCEIRCETRFGKIYSTKLQSPRDWLTAKTGRNNVEMFRISSVQLQIHSDRRTCAN